MDIYPQHPNIAQGNGVLSCVSNRALWRIEPYFDGISTAVTIYKVVDQNGTLQYMGVETNVSIFSCMVANGWV